MLQWEQKAILLDGLLIFIGTLLLFQRWWIYIVVASASNRAWFIKHWPLTNIGKCVVQACNRRIFLRVSKFHARYQEFEKRPLPRNIVQQILQIRIPPISQFLYKISEPFLTNITNLISLKFVTWKYLEDDRAIASLLLLEKSRSVSLDESNFA